MSSTQKERKRDKVRKKEGGREGERKNFSLWKNKGVVSRLRHYVIPGAVAPRARRCGGNGVSLTGASDEGCRAGEKVDQYQAERSAPTNLCGDPEQRHVSLSLQPDRFHETDLWKTDRVIISVNNQRLSRSSLFRFH